MESWICAHNCSFERNYRVFHRNRYTSGRRLWPFMFSKCFNIYNTASQEFVVRLLTCNMNNESFSRPNEGFPVTPWSISTQFSWVPLEIGSGGRQKPCKPRYCLAEHSQSSLNKICGQEIRRKSQQGAAGTGIYPWNFLSRIQFLQNLPFLSLLNTLMSWTAKRGLLVIRVMIKSDNCLSIATH